MKKYLTALLLLLSSLHALGWERQYLWTKGNMPDAQSGQIALRASEAKDIKTKKFSAKQRIPYLEWYETPSADVDNDACMILIPGGAYRNAVDEKLVEMWRKELTAKGVQCVGLVYRTPRPTGLPFYQSAWEDGQRAVRLVRSEAAARGFDPAKIGVIGMSAGAHLSLLLAANSQTRAYEPVDAVDSLPCHIGWAILNAPAYVTSDADSLGTKATREGYGPDISLSSVFAFDEKTCPMSLHHGGADPYSPNGSTLIYRKLRQMGIPAELHLYPGKGHGAFGFGRALEFMTQMGFLGPVQPEVNLMDRFADDGSRAELIREDVWPEGSMPDRQEHQCKPYLEWHIPAVTKTRAIQIIYSGGSYNGNDPDGFEVAAARRYLNDMGVTVVTLKYRTPRPHGLAKHITAWQDLQRVIRIVRSEAASRGLDPDRIGIMGSSAGGHLTLMGVTSSLHQSYLPVDEIDKLPCNVQWGIGIYPAYSLSDGFEKPNSSRGNDDGLYLAPEFSFDLKTSPMLLIHGDADVWASMNSVRIWEKMRAMGIQCELHTLALRPHCFQRSASPLTGSYNWLDRIGEYLQPFIQETL